MDCQGSPVNSVYVIILWALLCDQFLYIWQFSRWWVGSLVCCNGDQLILCFLVLLLIYRFKDTGCVFIVYSYHLYWCSFLSFGHWEPLQQIGCWDLFFFFLRVVLKYNLHIIKLAHFKCSVQWFSINLQSCTTITMIQI